MRKLFLTQAVGDTGWQGEHALFGDLRSQGDITKAHAIDVLLKSI